MHISNIPVELFAKILEYIPLKDASNIMLVNKEWYQEYRGIIHRQFDNKFEELLYSHWSDWRIPPNLVIYFNWHEFLIDKLDSFCKNFDRHCLDRRLQYVYDSLRIDMVNVDKEREVIDKLLVHYKTSPDFEGLFPEWLWEKHKNNRWESGENMRHKDLVYVLKRKVREQYGLWP